jgi:hypothetical protein
MPFLELEKYELFLNDGLWAKKYCDVRSRIGYQELTILSYHETGKRMQVKIAED